MHYPNLYVFLNALPLALAQYGPDSGATTSSTSSSQAPSSTTAAAAGIHTVTVGANNNIAFVPNGISALPGDIVEFHFFPPVHSVAQSSFVSPCTPFSNGTSFFSGAMTTSGSGQNANTFQLTINDTNPIWFYCAFPGHCEGGMAGLINVPGDGSQTLDQYVKAAANVSRTVAPATVQGGVIGPAKQASASSSTTSTSSSASPSPTKSAGIETRGTIRWMLLGFTGAVAVGAGSLIV